MCEFMGARVCVKECTFNRKFKEFFLLHAGKKWFLLLVYCKVFFERERWALFSSHKKAIAFYYIKLNFFSALTRKLILAEWNSLAPRFLELR